MPNQVSQTKSVSENIASYVGSLDNVKNMAQTAVSYVWFLQGVPRAVKIFASNVDVSSLEEMAKLLKPFESALLAIKTVGNFFEGFDKFATFPTLAKLKVEWNTNRCKFFYRFTSTFYITLESFVLIPYRILGQKMIEIGQWSLNIGGVMFGLGVARDAFTVISSGLNIFGEAKNIANETRVIEKCDQRAQGPLKKIQEIITKNKMLTSDQLDEVNNLKQEHWKTSFGKGQKADKMETQKQLNKEIQTAQDELAKAVAKMDNPSIDKYSKEIDSKKEKLERMDVWEGATDSSNLDKLRQVVVYKGAKNQVVKDEKETNINYMKVTQWYEGFKLSVVSIVLATSLGAIAFAPALGLSAVTLGSLLFLGQWVTGIGTGLCALGKMIASYHKSQAEKVKKEQFPTTHLLVRT